MAIWGFCRAYYFAFYVNEASRSTWTRNFNSRPLDRSSVTARGGVEGRIALIENEMPRECGNRLRSPYCPLCDASLPYLIQGQRLPRGSSYANVGIVRLGSAPPRAGPSTDSPRPSSYWNSAIQPFRNFMLDNGFQKRSLHPIIQYDDSGPLRSRSLKCSPSERAITNPL